MWLRWNWVTFVHFILNLFYFIYLRYIYFDCRIVIWIFLLFYFIQFLISKAVVSKLRIITFTWNHGSWWRQLIFLSFTHLLLKHLNGITFNILIKNWVPPNFFPNNGPFILLKEINIFIFIHFKYFPLLLIFGNYCHF